MFDSKYGATMPTNVPVILCMYSGGTDSVGMLYTLLSAPEWEKYHIHVHHMHLNNFEGRMEAEKLAVENTLKYFREHDMFRKFTYSDSCVNPPYINGCMVLDRELSVFFSSNIASMFINIRYVAIGVIKDDAHEIVSTRGTAWCDEAFKTFVHRKDVERIFPVRHMTGQQVNDMMPKELADMAWSCRTPYYKEDGTPIPCGRCKKCQDPAKHPGKRNK